jgi:hypothetical protein
MGAFANVLFGALLGVAIVTVFCLLISFIDDLRQPPRGSRTGTSSRT